MNIFKRASQLRKKHPHKYKDYQEYVAWARREIHGKASPKKSTGKKKAHKKAPARKKAKHVAGDAMGAVSFAQLRSKYKKGLEEKLAWGLLARDQAKNKTERKKKSKDVVQTRRELNSMQ